MKMRKYISEFWNQLDVLAYLFVIIGLIVKITDPSKGMLNRFLNSKW